MPVETRGGPSTFARSNLSVYLARPLDGVRAHFSDVLADCVSARS